MKRTPLKHSGIGPLTEKQWKFAVWAIRIMRTRTENPIRLRNWIAANCRLEYTLPAATRMWERWRKVPCRSLVKNR